MGGTGEEMRCFETPMSATGTSGPALDGAGKCQHSTCVSTAKASSTKSGEEYCKTNTDCDIPAVTSFLCKLKKNTETGQWVLDETDQGSGKTQTKDACVQKEGHTPGQCEGTGEEMRCFETPMSASGSTGPGLEGAGKCQHSTCVSTAKASSTKSGEEYCKTNTDCDIPAVTSFLCKLKKN